MLKTGFEKLDAEIGGLKEKNLLAIISRPGVGKSTVALNIINHVASQTNEKILYFNLETSKEHLRELIESDSIEMIDTPRITTQEIKKKCEEASAYGIALVVIDYLQLIYPTKLNVDVSENIEHISETLKAIAVELNIPILVLSQVSRQFVEREKEEKFHLVLQESSPLLQHADKIIFLYRESYYKENNGKINKTNFKEVKTLEGNILIAIID